MEKMDYALACAAVETAVERHSGSLEQVFTPCGLTYVQSGKDLRRVKYVVATGGALIHAKHTEEVAKYALFDESKPGSLRPEKAEILIDRSISGSNGTAFSALSACCAGDYEEGDCLLWT